MKNLLTTLALSLIIIFINSSLSAEELTEDELINLYSLVLLSEHKNDMEDFTIDELTYERILSDENLTDLKDDLQDLNIDQLTELEQSIEDLEKSTQDPEIQAELELLDEFLESQADQIAQDLS